MASGTISLILQIADFCDRCYRRLQYVGKLGLLRRDNDFLLSELEIWRDDLKAPAILISLCGRKQLDQIEVILRHVLVLFLELFDFLKRHTFGSDEKKPSWSACTKLRLKAALRAGMIDGYREELQSTFHKLHLLRQGTITSSLERVLL